MEFFEQWTNLENTKAKVLLKHSLFGRQIHTCDSIVVINDNRIGLVLKKQEVFVYKKDILYTDIQNNVYSVSDGILTITIYLNKL
jgi:hypothetical protein